jgi:biopolymer transport protein ExbB
VLPAPLVRGLRRLIAKSDVDPERARAICDAHPSSASMVVRAAADRLDQPREDVEQAVNNVAQREIHELRKYVRVFNVIASVAPLLGLLGTVTGMIQAFRRVAEEGLGSGQGLAPGIYTALVTTAAGLLVAIPALVTYHWFMSRIDNYVHEMDVLVVDFVDASRRPAAEPVSSDVS